MTLPPLALWQYTLQVAVLFAQVACMTAAFIDAMRPAVIEQGRAYPVNRKMMK